MAVGRIRLKPMGYDFPPYRPPSEAGSLLLRVTRGCTWNRCTFCSMYRDIAFQRRPSGEVKRDIEAAATLYRNEVRTVFIGDSNSLSIQTDTLVDILGCLYGAFPGIERVTSYARAKTLLKKSRDDLKRLRQAGLTRLHVGLESGNAEVLKSVSKGATPDEIATGCLKAKEAGFELSLYILIGLGGEEHWKAHACDTAALLSRIDPHFIRIRTLQPQPGSELYEAMEQGSFEKVSHETALREQRLIVENLEVTSEYLSDHITNYVSVNGRLPEDRPAMLAALDDCLAQLLHNGALRSQFARKDTLMSL